jgi:hypothetical protein
LIAEAVLYTVKYRMTKEKHVHQLAIGMAAIGIGLVGMMIPGHSAAAQMAKPQCATIDDAKLPADLKPWAGARAKVTANAALPETGAAELSALQVGTPAAVTLQPTAAVRLVLAPEQVRTPDNPHAGLLRLVVPATGAYRFSSSTPLWVDIIRAGKAVPSTAHGAMAPCTTLRKVVEFPLALGEHVVQLSGNPGPDVIVMVSTKP